MCDVRGLFSRSFVICIPVNPSPGCKSSLDGRGLKRHFTEGATPLPFVRGDRVKHTPSVMLWACFSKKIRQGRQICLVQERYDEWREVQGCPEGPPDPPVADLQDPLLPPGQCPLSKRQDCEGIPEAVLYWPVSCIHVGMPDSGDFGLLLDAAG